MKNIRIRVTSASKVVVSAPFHISERRVHTFVDAHQNFVLKKLEEFNEQRKRFYPNQYQNGDSFWFLGSEIKMHIVVSQRQKVEFTNGQLTLYVSEYTDLQSRKDMFIKWYKNQAKRIFNRRVNMLLPQFSHFAPQDVKVSVRNMLTRWGSINSKRHTMSLTVHLLRCEVELIDYVIMHELCHFSHNNHSKAFYNQLDRHCSDRKLLDKRLKEYGLIDF